MLAVVSFAAFGAFLFLSSLYLQEARGLSASTAGLVTLPTALALVVSSPLSGRLVAAGQARLAIVVAGAAISCGALLLTRLENDTPLPVLLATYALFGVGLGSIGAPVNTAAVSGMPRSQAGLAAAVAFTSRQVGTSLGVALAGSLAGSGIDAARHTELAASTHRGVRDPRSLRHRHHGPRSPLDGSSRAGKRGACRVDARESTRSFSAPLRRTR